MRKTVLLTLMASTMLIAGCSSGSDTSSTPAAPPASVTLTIANTGNGIITSNPPGINCGATCTLTITSGTVVTLTAAPAPNNTLASWGGACATAGATCAVTVTSNQTVSATFNTSSANPALTVTSAGTGAGTVTCNGGACSPNYPWGTSVTLSDTAQAGSSFAGWSGGGCSGTANCTVLLWGDTAVTATFNPLPVTALLTVSKNGTGTGTVTSSPLGINCGATCSATFSGGATVTLTSAASAGSTFVGWSGGGCAGTGTCDVILNANTSVTATFNTVPPASTLTVTTAGTGTGTVTCNGTTCSPSYPSGTALTIVATPAATSLFSGWGGACAATGTATTCNLTINANSTISATFNLPTLSVIVAGTGTVTSNPAGINCGATCTASFNTNTSVILTASGTGFGGWSGGGCSGTGTCTVTLTQNTTITATFGAVSSSTRYRFFTQTGGGPLMAVNPSAPSATPTTVATVSAATEAYAGTGWNSTTGTFDGVTSPYEVYISGGKLWRINSATSSGVPGGAGNLPVQISNETAATGACYLSVIDDTTPIDSHLIIYKCGTTTKLTSFADGPAVAPVVLSGGLVSGGFVNLVYNLATGVASHIFLQDVNNGIGILNLSTRTFTPIQANFGPDFWVIAQDTSDRVFLISKLGGPDNGLYVYTISTNSLVQLISSTTGGILTAAAIPSDGTNVYVFNITPGILYKAPLTATSAAQVTQLLDRSPLGIGTVVPTTTRLYVSSFNSGANGSDLVSIPKSGGALRVDVAAANGQTIIPFGGSANGLMYFTQFTVDTAAATFPQPVTSSFARILNESGTLVVDQSNSAFAGAIFNPTYSVRSEEGVPSKLLVTGFSGSTYAGGTMRVLDAATGVEALSLGTMPTTAPAIFPYPGGALHFIEFLDGASLGYGFLSDVTNSAVFFLDTSVSNSLVQVPVSLAPWETTQN